MSTSVISMGHLTPGGDLNAYINTISAYPIISAEEERKLAERFYDDGDLDAARELIVSHLRFVVYLARTYRGYGLAEADLIQEGNVGLLKAVKKFDPNRGVRLLSFAAHWIRAEIHEFIFRNWRIVKIATTKAQRKLFFKLREKKKSLGWLTKKQTQQIAEDLGVRPQDVTQMEGRLASDDVSYDGFETEEDEHPAWIPGDVLVDNTPTAAQIIEDDDWIAHRQALLDNAMSELDERSKAVLHARWLSEEKATLHDLAAKFGVSAERIRQIENKAMSAIREQIATA